MSRTITLGRSAYFLSSFDIYLIVPSFKQVAEMVAIADSNGWVRPTVYQGLYNALERRVETE